MLRSLGLDVSSLLASVGISDGAWADPDGRLPLYALDSLLVAAEAASGCDHVGLLIGVEPADLGLPSYILANAPDLGTGLRDVIETAQLMHDAAGISLSQKGDLASLKFVTVAPGLRGYHHIADCALAQLLQAVRRYSNGRFLADEILLPRRPPKDSKAYRSHYSAKLLFNSDAAEIRFPATTLNMSRVDADPALYRFLKDKVRSLQLQTEPLTVRVSRLISLTIFDGRMDRERVTSTIGLSSRAFQRQLKAEGASFNDIVGEVRYETAKQLLLHTDLDSVEIALGLRYCDSSAFSREFSKRAKMTPSEFRSRGTTGQ